MTRCTSSSLPMTGSSSPSSAFWFRSIPYCPSASSVSSPDCESICFPPRMDSSVFLNSEISTYFPRISLIKLSSALASSQASTARYWSPLAAITPSAFCSERTRFCPSLIFSLVTVDTVGSLFATDLASSSTAALSTFILLSAWFKIELLLVNNAQIRWIGSTSWFLLCNARETPDSMVPCIWLVNFSNILIMISC
ncbi:hypothetical protein MNB_SV-10-1207 [hydrothermal vent metagenome]|uniref:Uncharacterized protein n=1 Tax=hydrothermal vent metagenome TaxID=652676 RepID=A0A1W1C1J8_9ZZZZ